LTPQCTQRPTLSQVWQRTEAAETFKELGRTPLDDKCYATPAVAGNRLIIRTASKLMCVGK
jgi:hypothetical protein